MMAYPTRLTIASERTVSGGDSENATENEGIARRRVRVSVTYRLERADVDLLHVTAVRACEVDAAQEVAWHHLAGGTEELPPGPPPPTDEDDPLEGDPDEDPEGNQGQDEDWPDDGPSLDDGDDREDCHGEPPPGPERVPLGIRKPQKMAIMAQARRLGLSDMELAEMIKSRFGKTSYTPRYVLDKLTKKEGDALLRALGEREWEAIRATVPERTSPA